MSFDTSNPAEDDALMMQRAVRQAHDEDTILILNAMANGSTVHYYLVPSAWLRSAWPVLLRQQLAQANWRQTIGKIENSQLLEVKHAISEDDDEDVPQQSSVSNTIRRGLVHGADFCCLGTNLWMLLREKFGYDGIELQRPCVRLEQNTLGIQLDDQTIPIPVSGRFDYEQLLQKTQDQVAIRPQQPHPAATAIAQAVAKRKSASDVVSEEDDDDGENSELQDLFPCDDDNKSNPQSEDPENSKSFLYPTVEDMDYDKEEPAVAVVMEGDTETTSPPTKRKRYGSGLGNLGNTCFMNSTLQCLAHTEPLRRYFLSGEFSSDLNRDNPLGTGGELATQFAALLSEMWGTSTSSSSRRILPHTTDYGGNPVVYPRNFKITLGRHAEQFLGYDQHDSQELATYLLDALHEDTNRVTKKPYIEKPEQGEDEPDHVAADKSWSLHLQREDSRVLENFMGQVKSRVQCSAEGCGRVSTTFDPFMYLSVPIPGATDRTMRVTFIPLEGRTRNISVTLNKTASVGTLLKKMNQQLTQYLGRTPIPLEDLCPVDVWNHELYGWHKESDEVDKIRDSDYTYIYELQPVSKVQVRDTGDSHVEAAAALEVGNRYRSHRAKLDLETRTKLNKNDMWTTELENYVRKPTLLLSLFNPNRGTIAERIKFYRDIDAFLEKCTDAISDLDPPCSKRAREDSISSVADENDSQTSHESAPEDSIPALVEVSSDSVIFRDVRNLHDVAILEFCAGKLRPFIMRLVNERKNKYKDGIIIQIMIRCNSGLHGTSYSSGSQPCAAPLLLRIPSSMTVYGLREELSRRLARCLKTGNQSSPSTNEMPGEPSAESGAGDMSLQQNSNIVPLEGEQEKTGEDAASSPDSKNASSKEMLVMRQLPLSYEKKSAYSQRSSLSPSKKLGMLDRSNGQSYDSSRPIPLASESDDEERECVADLVGPQGIVYLEWPAELYDRYFDRSEYEVVDDLKPSEDAVAARTRKAARATSVLDCIDKYCQKEQLEESEMWYCNRCHEHVRAWKQFHLYRTPPILIVHLKRFHFSATTHRRDKIDSFIDFPLTGLDLTDKVMHWTEEEKPIYDCYAVSNHYGGLGGGHYTAYVLSDDGVWCHYDDSRVTVDIDPKEVVSAAAYCLYYKRRDVAPAEEFYVATSSPTPAIVQDNDADRETDEVSNSAVVGGDGEFMDVDADGTDISSQGSRTSALPLGSDGEGDAFVDDDFGNAQYDTGNSNIRDFPSQ